MYQKIRKVCSSNFTLFAITTFLVIFSCVLAWMFIKLKICTQNYVCVYMYTLYICVYMYMYICIHIYILCIYIHTYIYICLHWVISLEICRLKLQRKKKNIFRQFCCCHTFSQAKAIVCLTGFHEIYCRVILKCKWKSNKLNKYMGR